MTKQIVPPTSALKANYPTPSQYDHEALFKEFGMKAPEGPQWENTCAVRMSYCLLKCGIELGKEPHRGPETVIKTGRYKGKDFWCGRQNLAKRVEEIFGKPTYVAISSDKDKSVLEEKIGDTGGIISYGKLEGEDNWLLPDSPAYQGGHIDVVYFDDGWLWDGYALMIGHDWDMMFRRAVEIRFWKSGTGIAAGAAVGKALRSQSVRNAHRSNVRHRRQ